MPEVQVDKGAIRFVLGGANIMCPGLTSRGGRMEEELPAETAVVRIHFWKEKRKEKNERRGKRLIYLFICLFAQYRRFVRRGRRWCWPWG